jgi:hypothetical protein
MTTTNKILAAFEEAGHEYIDITDLAETSETLDDFKAAASGWAEGRLIDECEYGGFAALEFDGVQVAKGQPRRAVTVIDFGNTRYAYKI